MIANKSSLKLRSCEQATIISVTRNGAEQLASSTTTGITEPANAYTYNTLNQLTKSGPSTAQVSYAYDAVDRLTGRNSTTTQAFDAGSQLCWSKAALVANPSCSTIPTGATKYTYDTRGNRTVKTPSSGTATTYTYDQGNHLTSISGAATYAFDGEGLRLSKTLTGKTATRMAWDRSTEIPNLIGDGANTYIYGPDGAPLEQITSAGVVTFLHHDQLGSTRLITSTSGANVASYRFDPYGTLAAKTGTATTPFGYAGQYTDAESGLIYMRARYYDPATGTFTSADPIGSLGSGQNLYGYVGGDPVNFVDPSGLYGVSNAWDDIGGTIREVPHTIKWWGEQAASHPGTAIAIAAGVTCVFTAGVACTAALAAQAAYGTYSSVSEILKGCYMNALTQAGLGIFPVGFAGALANMTRTFLTEAELASAVGRGVVRANAFAPAVGASWAAERFDQCC